MPPALRLRRTRRFLTVGTILLGIPMCILIFLVVFRVPIRLDSYRPDIEAVATKKLGREVSIEGRVSLRVGFHPELEVNGIRIGNPSRWPKGKLVSVKSATAKLRLFPLLDRKIDINLLKADGLILSLEKNSAGERNWLFPEQAQVAGDEVNESKWEIDSLDAIALRNLSITSRDENSPETFELNFHTVDGTATVEEGTNLVLLGYLQEKSIKAKLTGGALSGLLAGERNWPYQFAGDLENATVDLAGEVQLSEHSEPPELTFSVNIPNLGDLAPALGRDFDIGHCHLRGVASLTRERCTVNELAGELGGTDLSGSLRVDLTSDPFELDGELELGTVDWNLLRPKKTVESPAASDDEEDRFNVAGALKLSIDEVVNLGTQLETFNATLEFADTRVAADVSADFANSPVTGRLEFEHLENRGGDFMMQFESTDADAGELINYFAGKPGKFSGQAQDVQYTMSGTGAGFPLIWKHRDETILAEGATIAVATAGKPIDVILNQYQVRTLPGKPSETTIEGAYKEEAFSVGISQLSQYRAGVGQLPYFNLTANGAGASIVLRRTVSPSFDAEVIGSRLGELAPWLGISTEVDFAYRASGELSFESGSGWRVRSLEGKVSSTVFSGEIGIIPGAENPLVIARLDVGKLDTSDLTGFARLSVRGDGGHTETPIGETEVLPAVLAEYDADVEIAIESLQLGGATLRDIDVAAELRNGMVTAAPVSLAIGGTAFRGEFAVNANEHAPEVELTLNAAGDTDLSELVHVFGFPEKSVTTAGSVEVELHARGSRLDQILKQSDLAVRFQNLHHRTQLDDRLALELSSATGSFTIAPRQRPTFIIDGQLEGLPFKFQSETESLLPLFEGEGHLEVVASAKLPDTNLTSEIKIAVPTSMAAMAGTFAFRAENLSVLDSLLDIDLPPLKGCHLDSRFAADGKRITFTECSARVGETDFQGEVEIDTSDKRPRLLAELQAGRFQLKDFFAEGWSPELVRNGETGVVSDADEQQSGTENALAAFLSSEVLQSHDAKVSLSAVQVFSGKEILGGGSLSAILEDGKLTLDQIRLELPGGEANMTASYHTVNSTIESRVTLKVINFDYGIAARNKKADSKSGGQVNIDLDLHSKNHVPGRFLTNATGKLKFAVCPDYMEKEVFDLWATNLVLALVPKLDPDDKSKVNCIVGELVMEDGILFAKSCFIDATRVRAQVSGSVDFKNQHVDLEVIPRGKRPQLLSLNTPVKVHGKFDDFGPRITADGAIRTVAGVGARTALFPLELLTAKRPPEDGSDICPCKH